MVMFKCMDYSQVAIEFMGNLLVLALCLPCGWLAAACYAVAGRLDGGLEMNVRLY